MQSKKNIFIFFSLITLFTTIYIPTHSMKYDSQDIEYNIEEDQWSTCNYLCDTLHIFCKTICSKNFWCFINKKEKKQWYTPEKPIKRSLKPAITWIGHATVFIQIGNVNILTDPNFSGHMLLPWLYKRAVPLGIEFDDLPPIDYVILSHNHEDHLQPWAIQQLAIKNKQIQFLIPKGDKRKFIRWGIPEEQIQEFCHKEKYKDKKRNISFRFLFAKHTSGRSLFDQNKSFCGSWRIKCHGFSIYFAGDTAYGEHFKKTGNRYKTNIALLPIGPNEPRDLMNKVYHMSAQQAGQAFLDLGAEAFIPIHWGTFPLGTDRFADPVCLLTKWMKKNAEDRINNIHFLKFGERMIFEFL